MIGKVANAQLKKNDKYIKRFHIIIIKANVFSSFIFFFFHEFDFYKFFNNRSQHLKNVKIFSCSNFFFKYFVVFLFIILRLSKIYLIFSKLIQFFFLNFQTSFFSCVKNQSYFSFFPFLLLFCFASSPLLWRKCRNFHSSFLVLFIFLQFVWLNSI